MFKTEQKCFIARPRRFGKTLMLSTINNLYLGNHKLFEGLEIYKYLDDPIFQPHPVISLNMSAVTTLSSPEDISPAKIPEAILPIEKSLFVLLDRIAAVYDVKINKISPSDAFGDLIYKVASKHDTVVILIDEYDCLLTETLAKPTYQKAIYDFLRNFYINIKKI
jgi:hypothetical protein